MARCNSSTLLTNLGLRYCSGQQGGLGMEPGQGAACIHTGSSGSRPYRSMENLNWNTLADSGLCSLSSAPYRSVDSEFILRYTSTSHWYDGSPDSSHGLAPNPESLAFYPRPGLPRKDLPLFPQLLFPSGVDEWDARKGLREKLRLQSARSAVEPLKPLPLRPTVSPCAVHMERESVYHGKSTGPVSRPPTTMRITSPEEIKQEVLRRLQLRRQNSSPNLALHSAPSTQQAVKTSYTTDSISGNRSRSDSTLEPRRPPLGRLHIPTFEEFKRMRQMERKQNLESTVDATPSEKPVADLQQDLGASDGAIILTDPHFEKQRENPEAITSSEKRTFNTVNANGTAAPAPSSISDTSTYSPIRTGPSPRSPLPPQGGSAQEKASNVGGGDGSAKRRRSSLEPAGSVPFLPSREKWERPSSCCPALLLDGTELSSYGAKIYKMKDGLIGSALDLIKKRLVEEAWQEREECCVCVSCCKVKLNMLSIG